MLLVVEVVCVSEGITPNCDYYQQVLSDLYSHVTVSSPIHSHGQSIETMGLM